MEIPTIIFLAALVLIQFGFIFYQQDAARAEREELLNRIMAANWQEYNGPEEQAPRPGGGVLKTYYGELNKFYNGRVTADGGDT